VAAVSEAGPASRAPHLAAEGLVAEGYEVLLIGKQRALEGEANFEPAAEAIEEAWDGTIRRYARRWVLGGVTASAGRTRAHATAQDGCEK